MESRPPHPVHPHPLRPISPTSLPPNPNPTPSLQASSNHRKGGLIGLAAFVVALGPTAPIAHLLPPIFTSFLDQDSRLRYYACESVYNICKTVRSGCIDSFESLFDGVCRLVADADAHVRNAAQLLDRLLKVRLREDLSIRIFPVPYSRLLPVMMAERRRCR